MGPYLAGTPYRADDPLLQLWVVATLIDSVLVVYEHLVRPLTLKEKQAYYVGGQQLARAFGIPAELMPPEYDDFQTYVDAMVRSDALTVGPAARSVVNALMTPRTLGPGHAAVELCEHRVDPAAPARSVWLPVDRAR